MNNTVPNRCIALAGMFQAAGLVTRTAHGERRDAAATAASISSILNTNPVTAIDVYGDLGALVPGLETLIQQLGSSNKQRDMVLTGYVISLMHLERKLSRDTDLMNKLASGIERIKETYIAVDEGNPDIIAALADAYKDTVSTLQPRIMVQGDENVLRNSGSKNMIRALLLAGVRAAVLWHQCGGGRIKLIFQRRQMLDSCRELLATARQAV
jgi:high frequency lysogenization protein